MERQKITEELQLCRIPKLQPVENTKLNSQFGRIEGEGGGIPM